MQFSGYISRNNCILTYHLSSYGSNCLKCSWLRNFGAWIIQLSFLFPCHEDWDVFREMGNFGLLQISSRSRYHYDWKVTEVRLGTCHLHLFSILANVKAGIDVISCCTAIRAGVCLLWFPANILGYIEARIFSGVPLFLDNCKHWRPTCECQWHITCGNVWKSGFKPFLPEIYFCVRLHLS